MKKYLVGGAVRDMLLGRVVKDSDYVVVGSTAQELLDLGYEQVGMGFPVFLHPDTREEYALARREKKVGAGYTGFEFETTTDVTLTEDLERRDLTINSMAVDSEGSIIDPFGGLRDLEDKILRHTSAAFGEDPLRVVRLARFYARYASLGFTVAAETMMLAAEMIARGDLNELPDERFWLELEKAFSDPEPEKFLQLLFELGALDGVEFFRTLFDGVTGVRLRQLLALVREVKKLPTPEFAVEMFAALVAPCDVKGLFHTARAGNIFAAVHLYNLVGSHPNGLEVVQLLTKCRAWSMGTMADDLVLAVKITEDAYVYESPGLPAWRLKACLEAGRSVTSAPYQHLEGKAIGAAMLLERVSRVSSLLVR